MEEDWEKEEESDLDNDDASDADAAHRVSIARAERG